MGIECAKDCATTKEEAALESIGDCIKAQKECMSAATGFQKFKCLIDLATCVGGETAKCAQKCGPPVVACVKAAIFGGKIADVPKCFATFIECAEDCATTQKEAALESIGDCIKAQK